MKHKLLFIHNGKVPFHITNSKTEREDEEVGHLNSITTFSLSTKNSKEDAENKIAELVKKVEKLTMEKAKAEAESKIFWNVQEAVAVTV